MAMNAFGTAPEIYHEGWIDFNKNGIKDPYEDSSQPVEKRVADLLKQMSLEEKIGQLASLREELSGMISRCRGGSSADCRVIEALSDHTLCESEHA